MTKTYDKLKGRQQAAGERNDCAVKAIAVATGRGYTAVRAALRREGRGTKERTSMYAQRRAITALGFTIAREIRSTALVNKTLATIEQEDALGGSWMIHTADHVAGMTDRTLHDWAAGKRMPVQVCWKIEKA
jgi:hypothetical protein